MSRPVPAAPSPGSSAARARLTEGDRRRIAAQIEARFKGSKPKPERVGIAHRFSRGDADWAILKDGSYWCFRFGRWQRGLVVTPLDGSGRGHMGVVTNLQPTWDNQISICVWFRRSTRQRFDDESGTVTELHSRPAAFWRPDQLEIIGRVEWPPSAQG